MLAIVDYGMGNLRSVEKGFARVGHAAVVTNDPHVIASADKVVLPGVGAFRDAIAELKRLDLARPLCDFVRSGRPFLGICLGLQLLFDVSFEDGQYEGLGILPGKVVRFQVPSEHKVPHMGWNQLRFRHKAPIFEGLAEGTHVYFVHSYYAVPDDPDVVAAETDYPAPFASAVWRENVFATQFHPEKSQADGLRILKNFAEL
ncbi:MAG: imidazole glycerol phosphate synthase subunit HisH [Planctomycetia bacterium]|nr:imidazole glycerol phosphate synthase subunit HisH [Planctomycetia bacterium]